MITDQNTAFLYRLVRRAEWLETSVMPASLKPQCTHAQTCCNGSTNHSQTRVCVVVHARFFAMSQNKAERQWRWYKTTPLALQTAASFLYQSWQMQTCIHAHDVFVVVFKQLTDRTHNATVQHTCSLITSKQICFPDPSHQTEQWPRNLIPPALVSLCCFLAVCDWMAKKTLMCLFWTGMTHAQTGQVRFSEA